MGDGNPLPSFEGEPKKVEIPNDIEELSLAYPIETVRGRYGGGVKVADGYYVGRNYLKPKQQELLKKLQSTLQGDDLEVMNSILRDFAL